MRDFGGENIGFSPGEWAAILTLNSLSLEKLRDPVRIPLPSLRKERKKFKWRGFTIEHSNEDERDDPVKNLGGPWACIILNQVKLVSTPRGKGLLDNGLWLIDYKSLWWPPGVLQACMDRIPLEKSEMLAESPLGNVASVRLMERSFLAKWPPVLWSQAETVSSVREHLCASLPDAVKILHSLNPLVVSLLPKLYSDHSLAFP